MEWVDMENDVNNTENEVNNTVNDGNEWVWPGNTTPPPGTTRPKGKGRSRQGNQDSTTSEKLRVKYTKIHASMRAKHYAAGLQSFPSPDLDQQSLKYEAADENGVGGRVPSHFGDDGLSG